jgi:thioredoxin 1
MSFDGRMTSTYRVSITKKGNVMDHMHHMEHGHSASFVAPDWLLFGLAALFLAGALFYLYRLLRPSHVRSVYGYFDWENEIGHGLCLLGMVTMLAPSLLPIPAMAWAAILGLGTLWFTARALTWGKRVTYPAKWWWDWAHVAMLGGMALMYTNVTTLWVTLPLGVFWLWLGGYYLYELTHDIRGGKGLYIGSDLAHSLMGFVMLLMTLFPAAFMPMHSHGHTMPGNSATGHQPVVQQTAATDAAGVSLLDDSNFAQEIHGANKPVVLLFFGGCEKCAQEVHFLDAVAPEFAGRAKLARIHTDDSPQVCQQFGVTKCPVLMVVTKTGIVVATDADVTDKEAFRAFIEKALQ